MRIGKDFHMSLLEIIAFVVSLVAVILGVLGSRITWPWWSTGSLLYAYIFLQSKYYASASLQIIFILGGIWGWLGWGPKGAQPKKLNINTRVMVIAAITIFSFALWPILVHVGATSTVIESFGFVGSVTAQLLMIWQKFEAWPIWLVVNIAYTYQYFTGELYLTSFLYVIFGFVAIWGWIRWKRETIKNELS